MHTGGLEAANSVAAKKYIYKNEFYEYALIIFVIFLIYNLCPFVQTLVTHTYSMLTRYPEMNVRSALVCLDFNHGVGRAQATDQEGNERFKVNVGFSLYKSKVIRV